MAAQLPEECWRLLAQPQTGAVLATPSNLAPEKAQGRSEEIGPAADVWALGDLLDECLTGRSPFESATVLKTLEQVCGQEPVPPARLNPKVPRDLETSCLKCLQKEATKCSGSAAALAEDLRRFQAGELMRARPVGRAEQAARWVQRNPVVAALLAAVALRLSTQRLVELLQQPTCIGPAGNVILDLLANRNGRPFADQMFAAVRGCCRWVVATVFLMAAIT